MLGCLHSNLGVNVSPPTDFKNFEIKEDRPVSIAMDSKNDFLSPNSSFATSSTGGRSKVALKPGRSLMDWVRLTHSGKDLSSMGGKQREITPRELAKHSNKRDAWICLKGKVYNITPYLEFHPGGEDELMRGAGKDATDLFNQIHKWVNAESMLQKCLVGPLKRTFSLQEVPLFLQLKSSKVKHNMLTTMSEDKGRNVPSITNWGTTADASTDEQITETPKLPLPRLDWLETDKDVTLVIIFSLNKFKMQNCMTNLEDKKLLFSMNVEKFAHQLIIELPNSVCDNYEAIFDPLKSALEIKLLKRLDKLWTDAHTPLMQWDSFVIKKEDEPYHPCTLIRKKSVNYNTSLFTFQLPPGLKMWAPVGHHVRLKSCIEGMEIIRSYTPVLPSLDTSFEHTSVTSGSTLTFMVKIYPMGIFTSFLSQVNMGDNIFISNSTGDFSETQMENCDSLVCIAAGTGITPMVKIIRWAINATNLDRSVLLLFFNKTEEDILWNEQFKDLSLNSGQFQFVNILSEADSKWNGLRGKISKQLLLEQLPDKGSVNRHQIFVCGPLLFTKSTVGYLKEIGYSSHEVHEFSG